ncbi:MAG: bifunctional ADP-dependent NAD(P)H-hydrate dehydratase/NAD(P)H-hydrate epimerase [Proteobacteria bacterium]|nr:bifunctional ADP-dependent NAD(P)H-hydrate dehydratase/NAD(P)H-hydrate epimerase [Pseudomonadota bacterium]
MRALEAASGRAGVPPGRLLAHAGLAIARSAERLTGGARGRTVLALIGKGNNGADALVACSHLARSCGWGVRLCLTQSRAGDPHLAWINDPDLTGLVDVALADDPEIFPNRLADWLGASDMVLDGLLGIGASGLARGAVRAILEVCDRFRAQAGQFRIAIDVPSGVDADTGAADPVAFQATHTFATGPAKVGTVIGDGAAKAGRVVELDIGIPGGVLLELGRTFADDGGTWRAMPAQVAHLLPARPDRSHKGTSGVLTATHIADVLACVERCRGMVIGPGLGTDQATVTAVRELLARIGTHERPLTVVVDADALNAISPVAPDRWPIYSGPASSGAGRGCSFVFTPHVAEMARLTGLTVETVVRDPVGIARESAMRWGVVVVLKGSPSVVASPSGTVAVGAYANAVLATAGSGDVLAGVIASLAAQGASPWESAVAGMTLHALAGEAWRAQHGSAGLRASDLSAWLPVARRMLDR